ncbi:MAG: type II toxin-antitoxin system RelE/ParE family toxin [Betaproteobacteria bacterium]|nr:MAG: type II toxin-antitoxin system RelE/ParE family toxin [Betaproteobacteria bacterium]
MPVHLPVLRVRFYRTGEGRETVREWLKALPAHERKAIGDDIRAMQFGWPIGMPLVRKMETGIWEIRTQLPRRIGRVFFTTFEGEAVLLHGFIKRSQSTPLAELRLARRRRRELT